jgi:hypothetical protein
MENNLDSEYTATHIGEGKFEVKMSNGDIKNSGPNMEGMIRYTYFEDYELPPIGWNITRDQLIKDYFPKLMKDVQEGKIDLNKLKPDEKTNK